MLTMSSGKTFEQPEIAPVPPAMSVHRIRESLPASTCTPCSVFSMYFSVLSKFPLESLMPMMFSCARSRLTVAGAMLLPARAGML